MKRTRKTEVPQTIIDLGNRINEIIKQNNFKQKDVAHDAGLDVENLRKYIKGTQEMKVSTMLKIVEALKIEVKDLFKTQ
ncbi:helix-turn-helix domain-containing protein [Flavobacterium sp. ZB4R12]|uniref:helix-turn-helix domain-containing protein n=1 Tax=Flavobacterium sp. ZB4R12 TaxID=3398732 RepID=UPI003AAE753E